MASQRELNALQKRIWNGSIPLEIRLASTECRTYDESDPYLIQAPRLSYIPFLLPRLHAFFAPALIEPDVAPNKGWLSFEGVPLKWHHPLGLLYDLYSGAEPSSPGDEQPPPLHHHHHHHHHHDDTSDEPRSPSSASSPSSPTNHQPTPLPWRLTAHFTTPAPPTLVPLDAAHKAHHDAFTNAVKEADFLRNGTAKAAMSLPKDAADRLWQAVRAGDLAAFAQVNTRYLVSPPGAPPLRNVPMKLYLPSSPAGGSGAGNTGDAAGGGGGGGGVVATAGGSAGGNVEGSAATLAAGAAGSLRVVQALVPPRLGGGGSSTRAGQGQPQTMGTALNGVLPSLFPSRRSPLLAQPVLHGAVVPLNAPLEELLKAAAYADGFLHVAIVMMS